MLDPFSDFLSLMSARSIITGGLVAGGTWAINFPRSDMVKFWGVVRGSCWLLLEEDSAPVRVEAGDVFLLCSPRSHVLGSDVEAERADLAQVLEGRTGPVVHHGDGDEFFMIGGKVELSISYNKLLLEALPSVIHVRASSKQAQPLRWLLDQLVGEQEDLLPGAHVASNELAHLMFIQILRAHFETGGPQPAGWLRVLGDRRLAPALQLMHGEPGRAWQLQELAQAAAMSRATFAAYFRKSAGLSPLSYLTEWRMLLAQRALLDGRTHVNTLARSLGYASESAFSNAFRRVTGRSPTDFRTRAVKQGATEREVGTR
ncbi:AraC family transcriptional regulator [Caballeronia sordidicola]|uniref:AraC family transcriptional regulator n=1 Tax=Caballeronia sordidicola TaxID=196367 RepID=UPI0004CFEC21|nr:AraC family transcriptional regulator [Caballeronia sordidicola]